MTNKSKKSPVKSITSVKSAVAKEDHSVDAILERWRNGASDKAAKSAVAKEAKAKGKAKASVETPAKGKATPAKAKSTTATPATVDKYGARLGTIRAKTNAAFSRVWKTMAQIEEETGIEKGKISGNLRDQVASGLLEVRKEDGQKSEFRLAK